MYTPPLPFFVVLSLIIAALLVSHRVKAQEFAPLGATWTYEVGDETPNLEVVAIQFTADRDTVLAGRSARVIEGANLYDNGVWQPIGSEIVTGNFDSVYVWIQDSFHLIFDFTVAAGDTVVVTEQPFRGFFYPVNQDYDPFTYQVDSVRTETIAGDDLLLQYVSYPDTTYDENITQWGFLNGTEYGGDVPGQVLQGVGSLGRESMLGTTAGLTYIGLYSPDRLTCYRDATRDYRFRGVDCEALIARYTDPSSVETIKAFKGRIYPNPFASTLHVEPAPGSVIRQIVVRDLLGRTVARRVGGDGPLDLSRLVAGTYQVIVLDGEGVWRVVRVVKR
ncbi:T9SS type A sorting domain-containing protein [Lewinella sp. IMCC34191]|uniref:T9SS type A sorting domain-containing protein n=1 Tax=Lewinella sp. IMCC34191 TaxID=2259172 RepID=UPI000E222D92|nr:T9SS type A sorting domain-containing protein [Lewinella sp. IMCC34191]